MKYGIETKIKMKRMTEINKFVQRAFCSRQYAHVAHTANAHTYTCSCKHKHKQLGVLCLRPSVYINTKAITQHHLIDITTSESRLYENSEIKSVTLRRQSKAEEKIVWIFFEILVAARKYKKYNWKSTMSQVNWVYRICDANPDSKIYFIWKRYTNSMWKWLVVGALEP